MSNTVERYVDKANFTSVITKVETKLQNRYTKAAADAAIASAIAGVTQFDYELVESLPATGEKGVIYLVPNQGTGSNLYNEYIWIVVSGEGKFENLGQRDLDISGKLENSDVKVDTTSLSKTNDQSGNGFTLDLSSGTKDSLALADTAVQPDDIEDFLVGTDVKVDGTTITKTPDAEGNGFTLSAQASTSVSEGTGVTVTKDGSDYEVSLSSATQASLALADSAVQDEDIEDFLVGNDVKVDTNTLAKTLDASGNGFTIGLNSATLTSLAHADSALQPGDVEPLTTSDVNDILAILTDDTVTP
jgi:hypothetical protein